MTTLTAFLTVNNIHNKTISSSSATELHGRAPSGKAFQMLTMSEYTKTTKLSDSSDQQKNSRNFQYRCAWFFFFIILVQLIHLLTTPCFPFYFSAGSPPENHSAVEETTCPDGMIYIYDLPPFFNSEILKNCDHIDPWKTRCAAFSNSGMGKTAAAEVSGIVPENVTEAWYWTDQFSLEVIFHRRILSHRCRTRDPESAKAFYIPFYAGLAVQRFLFAGNSSAVELDRHCKKMLNWVSEQKFYKRSLGWDHFIAMGRISWDFRRRKDRDWGSSCIYIPKMRNITRMLIEKNPWDYFDVGVPYPTGFHPRSASDIGIWQEFVRKRERRNMFCFAGGTRGNVKKDFRHVLLNQCYGEPTSCRVVGCGGDKCSDGEPEILRTFLDSDFCLQPRGDSFTRRSVFDCMVAGSIPVFFWHRTAYMQYEWFLPGEPESFSIFIHRDDVKNGTSIKGVLEKIDGERIRKMREKVIEFIPRIIYAKSDEGLGHTKDAFDVAVEGFMRRVKEQEKGYKWK